MAYLAEDPADPGRDVIWVTETRQNDSPRPYPYRPSAFKFESGGRRAALLIYGKGRPYYLIIDLANGRAESRLNFGEGLNMEHFTSFLEMEPLDW